MKHTHLTIREISQRWHDEARQNQPLSMELIGDLLDDFRQRTPTTSAKMELVAQPPVWFHTEQHADCNAYLAAVAETLCRETGLAPPPWTESPLCYLHRPWFACGLETLKALLLVESPVPFRRRNLFVSANALSRV